jgi:hypothetical protein
MEGTDVKIDCLVLVDVLYLAGVISRKQRDDAATFVMAVPNDLGPDGRGYQEWLDTLDDDSRD